MKSTGHPAKPKRLREAMEKAGYQILDDGSLGVPASADARGWLETGKIDRHGHHHDAVEFARLVESEIEDLADRIAKLLEAGWRSVRVVADHGWLLLPGGLPMVKLPKHLAESKWARSAAIAAGSRPDQPLHPWHWNANERFASPPGIACFSQQPEYAHGGLSIQECLIPDIRVRSTKDACTTAKILSASWVRLRCNISIRVGGGPLAVETCEFTRRRMGLGRGGRPTYPFLPEERKNWRERVRILCRRMQVRVAAFRPSGR